MSPVRSEVRAALHGRMSSQAKGAQMGDVGYELRTTADKGEGVFATRWFDVGEIVMVGVIERRIGRNHSHATQVGPEEFVQLGGLNAKVNHSCSPNCGVGVNASGAPDLVAVEPIAPGSEISFDYAMRNYTVEHFPSPCRCGAKCCRGTLTGWKNLPAELKASYCGLISPYLVEMDRQSVLDVMPECASGETGSY